MIATVRHASVWSRGLKVRKRAAEISTLDDRIRNALLVFYN